MPDFPQDLRYAARTLLRAPGFTALAAAVLALGIGANSAIFSVVDAAILRPLPFRQPESLAMLWEAPPGYAYNRVSPLNYQDWHDQNTSFSAMAAVFGGSKTMRTGSGVERIPGQSVTREFFDVLGIQPVAGRTFTAEDERTGANVVMIGEGMWRTRYGGDPRLIGSTLELDGKPYRVAGIVPAGFQILYESELWTLFTVKRSPEQRAMHYMQVLGRLKPGVSMEQARQSMAPIAEHIAGIAPHTNKGWGITVQPLHDAMVGRELRVTSLVLAGVVAFVLLLACANVANLMLARGAGRAREMAVRASLGAGRARLIRQLLTESVLLALLGGAAGLALSAALIQVAPALIPRDTLPTGVTLTLDARVAAFAAAVTLATGILFGFVPAWQVARTSLAGALRGGSRGNTAGHNRLLGSLAMVEIAVAVMVVAGAALFARTMQRLADVDPGFHAARVLTMRLSLPLSRYPEPARALAFYEAAGRDIEAIPGVRAASFGGSLPLNGWEIGQSYQIVGAPVTDASNTPAAHYQIVGARYFETLGIPLLAGRTFTARDAAGTQQVCVVNREFVRRHFHDANPLGAHVRVAAMDPAGPKMVDREIVGVIGQVRVEGLAETENAVEIYVPITQNPWFSASLAVRAEGDPASVTAAVKAAIAKNDPDLAVASVRTMDEIAYNSVARPRFRARLLGGLAGLALALAAAGIFGVLAFSVTQRTREFGIRMALGAQVADVLRIVLARGVQIAAGGVAFGLAGAALLARSLGSLLYGVKPLDPVAFLAAPALLVLVALAAAAAPAWRAGRVDPAITLREE